MKVPDSSMPPEDYWETLFDVPAILDHFGVNRSLTDVAELGCGYGTFTVPVARRISGTMHTFDIEPEMIARTHARAAASRVGNLRAVARDVLADGFELPAGSCDACLLFNILHFPQPERLIGEALRVLRPGGRVLVIHWRSDIPTPRGPSLEIRPRPEQIIRWGNRLTLQPSPPAVLPPWHFGVTLTKPNIAASDCFPS